MKGRNSSAVAGLLLLGLLCAGAAWGQAPACRIELHLEPAHPYVGQEVLWRLRILHPAGVGSALEPQPSFPDFRAEWIPPRQHEDPLTGMRIDEERRALFPVVAGPLRLPAAELRCGAADDAVLVPIPSRVLDVRPAPRNGRPAAWQGLVGPVQLSVLVAPRSLAVGQSLRVSVEVQGAANVWDVASPLVRTGGGTEAEIFPHPPQLARDTGERLVLRRYFTYDVVPRRAGHLEIPELRVPWLDPETGRYRVSRQGPFSIHVLSAPAPAPPRQEPGLAQPSREARPGWLLPAAAAGGLLLLAGAAMLIFAQRRSSGPAALRRAAQRRLPRALDRARNLESQGDVHGAAAELARAIRQVLTGDRPQATALSAEELRAAARDDRERDLAGLLASVEQLRFSANAGSAELHALLRQAEAQLAPDVARGSRGKSG